MADTGTGAERAPAPGRTASPGAVRGRPRRAGVEEAALQAAVDLIAERGYAGTTIDGIAQRAGLAKTTLYRRWDTKGALAVAALAARLGEPPVADEPGRPGRPALEETIAWLGRQVSDPSVRLLLVGLTGEAARDPAVRTGLRQRIREPFTQRLADRWEVPRARVDLAFDVVVGSLLHRVVMTGQVEAADITAVTGLATGLLFEG